MARRRSTRRGRGEGSVFEYERSYKKPDGSVAVRTGWEGKVTTGYDKNGKQRFKSVYGKTQAEVLEKVAKLKNQLTNGTLSDTKLTVEQYLVTWLKEKERSVKERTAMLYREQAERYVYPRLGRVKLEKLTPLHLQRLISELADEIGVPTANKVRTLMFAALKQAVMWGLIARNPCEAVAKLKEVRRKMKEWTPSETVQFLNIARTHRLHAAFYLAVFTGLRRGELLGLRWEDLRGPVLSVRQSLTLLGGKIHITTPKTRSGERHFTLSPDVLEVLAQHKALQEAEARARGEGWTDTGLVFTSEVGTPIHPRNFERTFKAILNEAKVTPIRLHDLRRLHVSLLVAQGLDPRSIADRIGHTNPSFTLDVYSHLFAEHRATTTVGMTNLIDMRAKRGEVN